MAKEKKLENIINTPRDLRPCTIVYYSTIVELLMFFKLACFEEAAILTLQVAFF